ncbi:hypothetical protein Oweho_3341 [Owenweeksia hongkongensis DSM 17368]|uniref:Cytochrome c domain-containing protein n=1 Tax=Owenweeksia hongkongensis (strain DSM 17368 / CIP 108786 / JCM 12287 / NRRL B-23963 / UST20020801) TaxID=926562 RepID=G8R4X8_OWEHD|nr:hypothetical protein [Owenweeksia hongkongensis]AEV34292.1 hypothetical protein Oweho_3341 [Owenweeksia hongkongensis DSM 17368]
MMKFRNIVGLGVLLILLFACEHKRDESENPFDVNEEVDTSKVKLKDATIEGLHQNVFSVRCANPTCHDGSFEPDFRTVQSTYSSLVYHPVTKNDDQGSFTYRVVPGNADESWIMRRVTVEDVLGRMPLYAEPLTTQEIEALKYWINDGARDMQGNLPDLPNVQPAVHGYQIQDLQQNRVDTIRVNGWGSAVILQANTDYDYYFYITDDNTLTENLQNQKIEFSYDRDNWTPFHQITPTKLWTDITKATFNTSAFQANTTVYLRYFVEDDQGGKTETPEDGSPYWLKDNYSIIVQ